MIQQSQGTVVPTVSIGMPVYNGENYIREALDSLLTQTFTDFELIISDNASTDFTESICREYASGDTRIRYVRQSENFGALTNFLYVLEMAKADYFMWTSHDDVFAGNDFLSKLVALIKNTDLELVFPDVNIISSENALSFVVMRKGVMAPFLRCNNRLDNCLTSVSLCNYQIYGLYRKSALRNSIKYLEKTATLKVYCEGLFVQAFTASYSTGLAKEATLNYRLHENNASRALKPPEYLCEFLKHSMLCVGFWLFESPLSSVDKTKVMFALLRTNGRYTIVLMLSSFKLFCRNFIGVFLDGWR